MGATSSIWLTGRETSSSLEDFARFFDRPENGFGFEPWIHGANLSAYSAGTAKAACIALALLVFGSGCACVERTKAESISRELRERSRRRAVEAMRALAIRHGATLLPAEVQTFVEPWECSTEQPTKPCTPWWFGQDRFARTEDPDGKPRIVVTVPSGPAAYYARLALRGDTLLLILPRVTARKVDEKTACACDDGLVLLRPEYHAFVIEDVGATKLETITMPVTEDFVAWECKLRLV